MLRAALKTAELDRLPAVEGGLKTPWLVVGAGVVGLACALRLQAAGLQVLVLDREGVAAGASRGNAGALAFSDVLPLASPGILRQAPRWLLDPLGPLALRPGYLLPMLPWLWKFWRASQPAQVARPSSTGVSRPSWRGSTRTVRP